MSGLPWRAPAALGAAALLGIAAPLLYVTAGPLLTDDLWWHLAMGEVYATQGPWPGADPLLHTAHADAPVQHEWLFGVLVHGVDATLGFHGLRAAHALAVAAILLFAYRTFRRESAAALPALAATVVFVVLAWWRLFQLRPDLVSIPATLAVYGLLLAPGAPPSRARVAAAVVLLAVWANLHSLFAIGLALPLAALLGLALRAGMARYASWRTGAPVSAPQDDGLRARRIGAALGLGLAASLANPRGFEQHLTFLRSSTESGIWRVADEWTPFDPFSWDYVNALGPYGWAVADALLLAFFAAALVAGLRFLRRPGEATLRGADPVAFGLGLAGVVALLVSIRFLWMGAFALLFVLGATRGLLAARPRARRAAAWAAAAACVALAASFPKASRYPVVAQNLPPRAATYLREPYVPHKYHLEGVRFLRETGVRGELFNKYVMGGFLGYWLAPRLRTFVDSRTEHYPAEVLREYSLVNDRLGARPGEGFADVLDRHGVDLFFGVGIPQPGRLEATLHTSAHLAGHPDWILVSRSVHHGIYLRRGAENRENLRRIEAWYAREGVPFDAERGLDPARVLRENPEWAVRHEMLPPVGPALVAAREASDPDRRFRALDALGRVHALLGAWEEQVALEREALALRPRARAPRRRLVYGLLRLGRGAAAHREAGALRALDDPDPLARQVVATVERYGRRRRRDLQGASGGERARPAPALLDRFPLLEPGERRAVLRRYHRVRLEREEPPLVASAWRTLRGGG